MNFSLYFFFVYWSQYILSTKKIDWILILNRVITVNFDTEEHIYFYHSRLESVYSLDRFIFHICSGFFGNILTTYFQLLQLVHVQEGNHYGGHGGGYSKSPSKTNSFLLSSLSDLAKSVWLICYFDSHLNFPVGRYWLIAHPYRLFALRYMIF